MQAEFIREERMDGTVVYYTRIDGRYISDSLSFNREKAEQYFWHIAKTGSSLPVQTVIQTAEVLTLQNAPIIASPDGLSIASSRLTEQTV